MSKFQSFNLFLSKYASFSTEELNALNEKCTIVSFKKWERFIRYNQVNNEIFFLNKGFVKYSIINQDGYEIVYTFRMEGMTVTAYSFYNNNIAKFNVECLEDCEFVSIPVHALDFVVKNFKNGAILRGLLAEAHILELVNILTSRDTKSVMERYNEIDKQFPNIHQRVPQNLIASFLGVSQEHLSRLKKYNKF